MQESLLKGEITFAKPEGIDRRYLSVKDSRHLQFVRNTDKPEANVVPEAGGSI